MVLTRSDQKHTQAQKKPPVSTQTDTNTDIQNVVIYFGSNWPQRQHSTENVVIYFGANWPQRQRGTENFGSNLPQSNMAQRIWSSILDRGTENVVIYFGSNWPQSNMAQRMWSHILTQMDHKDSQAQSNKRQQRQCGTKTKKDHKDSLAQRNSFTFPLRPLLVATSHTVLTIVALPRTSGKHRMAQVIIRHAFRLTCLSAVIGGYHVKFVRSVSSLSYLMLTLTGCKCRHAYTLNNSLVKNYVSCDWETYEVCKICVSPLIHVSCDWVERLHTFLNNYLSATQPASLPSGALGKQTLFTLSSLFLRRTSFTAAHDSPARCMCVVCVCMCVHVHVVFVCARTCLPVCTFCDTPNRF